jgi:hypothetical protein
MYLTKFGSSYNLYNSKLHLLLHCPLSGTDQKILQRNFVSNSPSDLSSTFESVQVSEEYVATGLVAYKLICEFLHYAISASLMPFPLNQPEYFPQHTVLRPPNVQVYSSLTARKEHAQPYITTGVYRLHSLHTNYQKPWKLLKKAMRGYE